MWVSSNKGAGWQKTNTMAHVSTTLESHQCKRGLYGKGNWVMILSNFCHISGHAGYCDAEAGLDIVDDMISVYRIVVVRRS